MTKSKFLGVAAALLALGAFSTMTVGCGGEEKAPPPASGGGAPGGGGGGDAAAAGGGGGEAYDPASATATVNVHCTGPDTKRRPIAMNDECSGMHTEKALDPSIIVEGGNVANVIVYVSKGHGQWSFDTPSAAVVLDQVGCEYVPHVFTMQTGQLITIKNSDPVMHNVHSVPAKDSGNEEFNEGQIAGAPDLEKTFENPETGLKIKCDVHGWMSTYAGVFDHPFHAVTGADGKASIKLPAGDYTIAVWHEKLKVPAVQTVTVADGESADLAFALTK